MLVQAMAYAIERSCVNKAEVVAADEREGGVRATLNLGHTFGHAMETSQGYGACRRMPHAAAIMPEPRRCCAWRVWSCALSSLAFAAVNGSLGGLKDMSNVHGARLRGTLSVLTRLGKPLCRRVAAWGGGGGRNGDGGGHVAAAGLDRGRHPAEDDSTPAASTAANSATKGTGHVLTKSCRPAGP